MYSYTKDSLVSTPKGKILLNNYYLKNEVEPFVYIQDVIKSILDTINEPLLYNYYLDTDIYRWIHIPTWGTAFAISLCRKDTRHWITIKKCVRRYSPVLNRKFCLYFYDKSNSYYKEIEVDDWFALKDDLFDSFSLDNHKSDTNIVLDGTINYLEIHRREGYNCLKTNLDINLFENHLEVIE